VIALQRSAGNAAVGRLLRQVGWPGTRATSPNHDHSTTVPGVDRYPLFDAALGGSRDQAKTDATDELSGNRVVVLVPSTLAQQTPAQVLLHFHGLNNPGYRASGRSVRDEDETRDRSEVQLAASIAEGDQQVVVVMPQGDLAAGFGDASTDPNTYIKRVLDLLRTDTGVSVTPAGLVVGGWSAGGNRAAEMAVAEAKSGQQTLDAVVLFEGVNNFQSQIEVDDPAHPGKKKKVPQDSLGGRDKLDIFLALVARNLKHDLGLLGVLGADATNRYLAKSFRFLAYYGSAGLYAPVHEMLDQGIRLIFGEPLTPAEESLQRRRLSGGLQLAARVPDSAGLAPAIAALPAAVRDELRRHYQVIRVAQVGDEAKHRAAIAAGKLDSLGHENSVGSGALLDALRRTRPMRPVVTPPGGGGPAPTTRMLDEAPDAHTALPAWRFAGRLHAPAGVAHRRTAGVRRRVAPATWRAT
jgi:acetyl esterase/lipase